VEDSAKETKMFEPKFNFKPRPVKRLFRVVYTTSGIDSRGVHYDKRWSELWKMDRPPLFEEVAKYWDNLGINNRLSNFTVCECDSRLPIDTPYIVEL
jgi:hypothetical protein